MLLTTHYLDEAEELADRVGVIARGRLVEVAVPAELGGRGDAPAVVTWTEDGRRQTRETATPTAFVRELAARFPGEVPDLAVTRPTLEDVYLRMIGEQRRVSAATTGGAATGRRLPSAVGTRIRVELKEFFRQRESVVFTLLFPVGLLLGFGSVLHYDIGSGVDFPQYFMAGVITAGIVGASLQNLAIHIAGERSDGTLKGLRRHADAEERLLRRQGRPGPRLAVAHRGAAAPGRRARLPARPARGDGLGHAHLGHPAGYGGLHPAGHRRVDRLPQQPLRLGDGDPGGAAAGGRLRGVHPLRPGAHWMQVIASLFPVKWMAQGLRSVFLPEALAAQEPAGSWELGRVALVLGVWCVLGLLLCVRTFRWQDRGDG